MAWSWFSYGKKNFSSFKNGAGIFVSEKDFNEWMTTIAGKEIRIDNSK